MMRDPRLALLALDAEIDRLRTAMTESEAQLLGLRRALCDALERRVEVLREYDLEVSSYA